MATCSVCVEKFTIALRHKVDAGCCDFSACSQCHQKYLLSSTEYAHCMNCRKGWTRDVLSKEFTSAFLNKTYKEHRENTLFDRERSLMPETQPYVEIEMKVREFENKIRDISQKNNELQQRIQIVLGLSLNMMGKADTSDARIERNSRALDIRKICAANNAELGFLQECINIYRVKKPDTTRREFVRACPAGTCKGFLSTAWKCGLCQVNVCSKCHEVKVENTEHTCNADNLASAEMISRDSKNCPKCAAVIFKISGCDQMWCTQCNTAFSWRTGRVEAGVIHNPHYYEYMRTHGGLPRAPGDVVCGGLPNVHHIGRDMYSAYEFNKLYGIHQNLYHIQHGGVMHRYMAAGILDNRDIRIKYMMDEISERDFKLKLQKREKAENRKRDIREVLDLYVTVCTDIFQRLFQDQTRGRDLVPEFDSIREHVTELLTNLSKNWKCAVPGFHGGYLLA